LVSEISETLSGWNLKLSISGLVSEIPGTSNRWLESEILEGLVHNISPGFLVLSCRLNWARDQKAKRPVSKSQRGEKFKEMDTLRIR